MLALYADAEVCNYKASAIALAKKKNCQFNKDFSKVSEYPTHNVATANVPGREGGSEGKLTRK